MTWTALTMGCAPPPPITAATTDSGGSEEPALPGIHIVYPVPEGTTTTIALTDVPDDEDNPIHLIFDLVVDLDNFVLEAPDPEDTAPDHGHFHVTMGDVYVPGMTNAVHIDQTGFDAGDSIVIQADLRDQVHNPLETCDPCASTIEATLEEPGAGS